MGSKSKVKRRERGEERIEPPPSFEPEMSAFLTWVQLEKGLAKNTVFSYENDLTQCALHLKKQGVSGWQNVELVHLSSWLASLTEGEYAVASLSRKLSAVRMLAKYLVGGWVPISIVAARVFISLIPVIFLPDQCFLPLPIPHQF